MYHTAIAESKFGKVEITPTDANHIHVSFGQVIRGSHNYEPLTIRGVEWSGSAHFYFWSDGQWRLGVEGKNSYERSASLYMSRRNVGSYSKSLPTTAARNSISEVLTPLVNEWTRNNPQSMNTAATEDHRDQVERLDAKITEAKATLSDLLKQKDTLLKQEVLFAHAG